MFDDETIRNIDKILANKMEMEHSLKDIISKESKANEFLKKWDNIFTKFSIGNSEYAHFTAHVMLGQIFKDIPIYQNNKKNDIRTHLYFLSPSGCLSEDTKIMLSNNKSVKLKDLPITFEVLSYSFNNNKEEPDIAIKIDSGIKKLYLITTKDGRQVEASEEHIFFVRENKKFNRAKYLKINEVKVNDLNIGNKIIFKNENGLMGCVKIREIVYVGKKKTYDLKVKRNNNFFLSNGILTHNSGKSSSIDFVKQVMDRVSVRCEVVQGQVSDAGLVGGYENINNKITKVDGFLEKFQNGGMFVWDETKFLLDSIQQSYGASLINYLTSAMNSFYSETNKIKRILKGSNVTNIPIDYHCKASFLLLSYPIFLDLELLLNTGFFQRIITLYNPMTNDKWERMTDEVNKAIMDSQNKDKKIDINRKIENETEEVVTIIKLLKERIEKSGWTSFEIDKSSYNTANDFKNHFNEFFGGLKSAYSENMNSFRIRNLNTFWTLASHHALANYTNVISKDDVEYAFRIMKGLHENFLNYIELNFMEKVADTVIYKFDILKKNMTILNDLTLENICKEHIRCNGCGGPRVSAWETNKFKEKVAGLFKISTGTAGNLITDWVDRGLMTRYGGTGKQKSYITF